MKFSTIDELLKYTEQIKGKTFSDFDTSNQLANGLNDKGVLGKIIETGFYKYENNNKASADFDNLGVELKITGYIKNKNGTISAKERMVLSKINYEDIIHEEFKFSKLLFKNKKILIIWYEYDFNKKIKDFIITNYQLYDMETDELIIKNDFEIIKEKVLEGKAHLLSEGDTSFLGACVKGINGEDKVKQPRSYLLAKPRAFSLKRAYLTGILRESEFALEVDNLEYRTVEEYVYSQIKQYIGKTQLEIYTQLFGTIDFSNIPKNIGKVISDQIIGKDEELPEKNSLFSKTNYKIKNIPIDSNWYPLERTPFRTIKLSEFDVEWENSEWKAFFEELTIIALCYEGSKDIANGYRVLKGIKKISFTSDDIDSFGLTYNMVQDAIKTKDISKLPYPGSFNNQKLEVAPKGQKGANAYDTFFENDKTKVCFMMPKDFIFSKLKENNSDDINEKQKDLVEKNQPSESFNIFKLFDYNLNKNLIFEMADNRINPYDIYLNKIESLNVINTSYNKKINIIKAVEKMIDSNDNSRCVDELLYRRISKPVIESLKAKGIHLEDLYLLDEKNAKDEYGIGNALLLRIKKAIDENTQLIKESSKNINTINIMTSELKKYTIDNPITLFQFEQVMSLKENYNIENFNKDFDKLQKQNKVKYCSFGVYYNLYSFKDYLKENVDERKVAIFIKRLNGYTLEQIGSEFDVTRERIRQICSNIEKILKEISFEEDRYKDIYEKYNWNQELFIAVFNENLTTYNYLKFKFNKGIIDINEILEDNNFTDEQKQIVRKLRKTYIDSNGNQITSAEEYLKLFIKKYAQDSIAISELTDIYNREINEVEELDLSEINERNLEGKLSRCDYVCFSSNHKVRYYDFNELSDDDIDQLKELIILSDGFYSTEYLFKNNLKLMKDLDIRDEYELHNILKRKIDDDENNVYFIRMPNFLVEYHEKEQFILDKIKELSPISVNDFIDILHDDYGHKKPTMLAYITSTFNQYITANWFNVETIRLSKNDINILKDKLFMDIYSYEEIQFIFSELGYVDDSEMITSFNMDCLGYRLKSGFAIKKEYSGIYSYLEEKTSSKDIIRINDNLRKCGAIYNALNYYCTELKLFKITDNAYVSIAKVEDLGISKEEILGFIKQIEEAYQDVDYFSINNIAADFNLSRFYDIGFDDMFIESLICTRNNISTLRINNEKLFSLNMKNLTIKKFMEDMVSKYRSISLEGLEKEISKNYQIMIPEDKLKSYLYGTDIFYSNILEKIYLDKNDYYEEVYDE